MAFDLKTFGIRTVSAVVFVVLLLGSVMFSYVSFSVFFFVIAIIGLNEFYNLSEKLGNKPYRQMGYLTAVLLYLLSIKWECLVSRVSLPTQLPFYLLALSLFLFLARSIFSKENNALGNGVYTLAGIIYVFVPFCLLHHLVFNSTVSHEIITYDPGVLLGVIVLIWINDTFAYIGGSLFGKRKLIERISPGKTIEGTLFGILMSFILAFFIKHLRPEESYLFWPFLGLIIPILATLGDLIESSLKRLAKVKDSGRLMPGHGGVLDRFDSLIFVSPFIALLLYLLQFQ